MDERKLNMLNDMFGKDLASRIVGKAESQTKAVEESGVSFKENDMISEFSKFAASLEGDAKAQADALLEKYGKPKAEKKEEEEEKKEAEEEVKTESKASDFEPITVALQAIAERLDGFDTLKSAVESLENQFKSVETTVKELQEKDSKAPKGRQAFRASESDGNLLDPDKIKELTGEENDQPVNPVADYIAQLSNLPAFSGMRS